MKDQSPKFVQKTFDRFINVISSAESWAGPSPSSSPAGPKTGKFGQAPAPASPSASQGRAKAKPMNVTYGPLFSSSSKSAALESCLVNRLKERLGSGGSIEYSQTWKEKISPAGRQYWAHTASARRTSGKGCIGWRTPNHGDGEGGVMEKREGCAGKYKLRDDAMLAGWATPRSGKTTSEDPETWRKRQEKGDVATMPLATQASMAGWATPRTPTGGPESAERKQELGRVDSGGGDLQAMAREAGWLTASCPRLHETDSTCGKFYATKKQKDLDVIAHQVGTAPASGGPAGTGSGGASLALNPAFSLWLQGFPISWALTGFKALLKQKGKYELYRDALRKSLEEC